MRRTERDEFQEKINLKFNQGTFTKTAFLTNFKTRTYIDMEEAEERMALLCYFQDQFGSTFKCYLPFSPYFYVGFQAKAEHEVRAYIENKVPKILKIQVVEKVDLDEINHLSGRKKKYLKISFRTVADLTNARKFLDLKKKKTDEDLYLAKKKNIYSENPKDLITDVREYDVPYHCRVCIDTGLRAGKWFEVTLQDKFIVDVKESEKKSIPDMKILAYDIETSKDPFKFPQKQKDIVMMISLMYEGEAVLIVNNDFCPQIVNDFQYEPEGKPQYRCQVQVFNVESEKQTLNKFSQIIKSYQPTVITSFNGDKFDYPFIQTRCATNEIDFVKEMGVNNRSGEYFGSYISHLDCFYWVDRDAFLPQGSRGLKAVTRAKLKYEPIQVDPQDMVELGKNQTQKLAQYSVSDAVATFFLYMKHIHGFIYALATIIPMMPDEVLRKGSGTLCENLLMAQAFSRQIIFPNKQIENFQKFYKGHLLDSQTYTGGKVECLRSGIYRADFETDFNLDPKAFQDLINNVDEIIQFTAFHEKGESIDNIENYDQVKQTLIESLTKLKNVHNPSKYETLPLIYHIDVAAMYPNIIITNRLQPVAIVNDRICSGCLFNHPESNCKRLLEWEWKGEYFPLNQGEYSFLKEKELMKEDPNNYNKGQSEKNIKNEVKKYCQKIYSKVHISMNEVRRDTVCMRQNSFYVDTVRAFRDRRYTFKALVKIHRARAAEAAKEGDLDVQKEEIKLMQLSESMQLAHKIILNSFYGYVMRKGSRWYSMETAAMVTYIGSNIINDSKIFVEGKIGKPLELDTDGIWMLLPKGFPEDVKIKLKNGKQFMMSYPCQLLNHLIYAKYTNPQYQELVNQQNFEYKTKQQMTIAFEIDGPYKAMFIPGGKEKKKTQELDIQQHSTQMLKKRYVVFNFKDQVSQFKGLQMKRRGQLNITKMFQSQIFHQYVKGSTLKQCYQFCAEVAMKYFSFILQKGQGMNLNDILQRLEESKNLSKDVNEYGESKGVGITSAKRLAQYLGPQVVKGKNLCCYYIIAAYPAKKTVTQRAIPTQIFYADEDLQKKYLYLWTKFDKVKENVDIKDILDWDYYKERLSTQIQKMVCIPAVMQNISNPIPQIQLPDWLQKKTFDMRFHRQEKIFSYGFGSMGTTAISHTPAKQKLDEEKIEKSIVKHQNLFENKKSKMFKNQARNPYSMKKNFKFWLGEQKKIWKNHKRELVQNESFKYYEYKSILQIVPDSNPGYFTVWYYSGGKIQNLLLNFNRHYYVKDTKGNKKAPREEGTAIEIIVEEPIFLKNQDHYDSILGRSFYETKVPLAMNLIMNKGNLWKINKQLSTYKEEDVHQVFGGQYLPNIEDNFMPIIYLSRLCVLETKYIFAVINPRVKQYNFIYVDNSKAKNYNEYLQLARKNIKRSDAKIAIQSKQTEMEAGSFVKQLLQTYEKQLKQPFLVVFQGDCPVAHLKNNGIDCLEDDHPVLSILPPKQQKMTILNWRQAILEKVIEQSENSTKNVANLLEWSRFTHIPICNLSENQKNLLDFITNITYGRILHSGDFLTWWNEYNSEIISTYESKANTGRIINSGLYSSFCIEINLDNLAVNTIANSEQLTCEDRQAALIMQKPSNNRNTDKIEYLDEMTQAKKAFEYLKKMVKGWLKDLDVDWEKANDLLRNFHKWISTHSNAMFDPLLLRMVNELMKKMFNILIRKLNNLGMQIIFANFSKIIVATDKHTYKEAQSTIAYILKKCMNENEKLFGYMTLNTLSDYYQVLLYEDPFNYVGVLVNEETEESESENKFEYSFKIVKLFNPIIQEEFQTLILQFINTLCEIKKELVNEYAENRMKLMLSYDELITERMLSYIRHDFAVEIQESLIRATKTWQLEKMKAKEHETQSEGDDSDAGENEDEYEDSFIVESEDGEFEERKKSKKKNKEENQILIDLDKWGNDKQLDSLIENLFHILNYEETYSHELNIIRKNAFRKINEQPNITHRLIEPEYPQFQLPCSVCFLVNEQPGLCEHCKQPINAKQELENSVWKMMQEEGRDIYCSRCNRIMADYLKKCSCGGKWEIRENPLSWRPYLTREDESWGYINKVFEFMGLE